MPVDHVREGALDALLRVINDARHVEVVLDRKLRRGRYSPQGSRFMTHLVYGVVRHKLLCDYVLSPLCEQPLDQLPAPVLMILRMGVYQQFFCGNVTRPAMVHTSVELAKRRSHAGLARMVNAVLRRVPDSLEQVRLPDRQQDYAAYLRIRYSMPRWMVRLWLDLYGESGAERFCSTCNEPAPLVLRTNTRATDTSTLLRSLQKAGVHASRPYESFEALVVEGGDNPLQSHAFKRGLFMVQGFASMLAGHLMTPEAQDRILDMCAAPGGKATHMALLALNNAQIIAQERFFSRMSKIQENCARMGLSCVHSVCGDGLEAPFLPGSFDKILVDAPCSGLGTLRQHPEIKWRTEPDAPGQMATVQLAMLRKAAHLCKNGGLIVYSVCTVTPEETVNVVAEFLSDGGCVPEDGPELFNSWKTAQGQYQTTPMDAAWDGFFLMRFRKLS